MRITDSARGNMGRTAMVLGKLSGLGRLTYSIMNAVRQGPIALAKVVVLLFYVHGKHLRSCRDGQLT